MRRRRNHQRPKRSSRHRLPRPGRRRAAAPLPPHRRRCRNPRRRASQPPDEGFLLGKRHGWRRGDKPADKSAQADRAQQSMMKDRVHGPAPLPLSTPPATATTPATTTTRRPPRAAAAAMHVSARRHYVERLCRRRAGRRPWPFDHGWIALGRPCRGRRCRPGRLLRPSVAFSGYLRLASRTGGVGRPLVVRPRDVTPTGRRPRRRPLPVGPGSCQSPPGLLFRPSQSALANILAFAVRLERFADGFRLMSAARLPIEFARLVSTLFLMFVRSNLASWLLSKLQLRSVDILPVDILEVELAVEVYVVEDRVSVNVDVASVPVTAPYAPIVPIDRCGPYRSGCRRREEGRCRYQ